MRRSLLLLATLVVSTPALAQITSTVTLNQSQMLNSGTYFPSGFHKAGCDEALQGNDNTFNSFQLSWTIQQQAVGTTGIAAGEDTFQSFGTNDSTCPAPNGDAGFALLTPENEVTTDQVTVSSSQLLQGISGQQDPCDNNQSGIAYICILETLAATAYQGAQTEYWNLIIPYDMSPPAPPTSVSVQPEDSELAVTWSFPYDANNATGDNADHFIIYAQQDSTLSPDIFGQCGGDGGVVGATVDPTGWAIQSTFPTPTLTTNSTSLGSLTNGQCYDVSIIAFYPDGTQGNPSPVQSAAPIEVWDYWRLYHSAGGQDGGGVHCQSAGGTLGPLALVLVGLFWLTQRRRAR